MISFLKKLRKETETLWL